MTGCARPPATPSKAPPTDAHRLPRERTKAVDSSAVDPGVEPAGGAQGGAREEPHGARSIGFRLGLHVSVLDQRFHHRAGDVFRGPFFRLGGLRDLDPRGLPG